MTKEVIKGRIDVILDGYNRGITSHDQTVESIANIAIEGATVLALDKITNEAKQKVNSKFNSMDIKLKEGITRDIKDLCRDYHRVASDLEKKLSDMFDSRVKSMFADIDFYIKSSIEESIQQQSNAIKKNRPEVEVKKNPLA